MSITVKLTQVPGATQEFGLEDNTTVKSLLDIAGKDAGNYAIRVNGASADINTVLTDNAAVLLSKNAVGNG